MQGAKSNPSILKNRQVALILISLLLLSSSSNTALADSGSDTARGSAKDPLLGISVDINEKVMMSDESLQAVFSLSGLSSTDTYILSWNLREGNTTQGNSLASDLFYFQPSGSNHYEAIEVWHFSTDSHLYLLTASIQKAGDPASITDTEQKFAVFRKSLSPDWTDLVMFGDSLSDTGNSYREWGTPDSPPYFGGRFTNGKVWLDRVHQWMGVSTTIGQGSDSGNNRAYGGATSENGYYLWVVTNVGRQVDDYTDTFSFDADEAIGIWAGGNDIRNGVDNGMEIVNNIEEHAIQVIDDGAETLLLFELPPIDRIPEFRDDSAESKAEKAERIDEFNAGIATLATDLTSEYGTTVYLIPAWQAFEEIYWNPSAFGFDNITHSACEHSGITCDSNDPIDPVPNRFIFFDDKHPTMAVHKYIAMFVKELVGESDYDGDGLADDEDLCDDSRPGEEVDSDGCPPPVDTDGDGILDEDDDCAGTPDGQTVDENGCAASQRDSDGDGVSDADDQCPETASGAPVNSQGCSEMQADYDLDGIVNALDDCSATIPGREVDDQGCSAYQRDTDSDGILDAFDLCPSTATGKLVDENGCSAAQRDADGDGVSDESDQCSGTDSDEQVDENGCSASQRDSDLDGYTDSEDQCPETPEGEDADRDGCGPSQRDTDSDGLMDSEDPCPETVGSVGGCPAITVELELLNEMMAPGMARIAMTLTCEGGCKTSINVDGKEYGRLAEGTHLLMVAVDDGQTVVVNGSFGTSFQIEELTITFSTPEPEPEPEPEPQPSPEPSLVAESRLMPIILAAIGIAAIALVGVLIARKNLSESDE